MPNNTGIILNIQKFCIHDGPGIRTTVFFKGCPLRCKWCSNPESRWQRKHIMYDLVRCQHCGACVCACPREAISFSKDGLVRINEERCSGCGICAQECSEKHGSALSIHGDYMTTDKLMRELIKDKVFYESSGGGVTFSGGEVLTQVNFACQLAHLLHEEEISVACETTGFASTYDFQKLLNFSDIILFDVKHYDDKKHFDGTGVHLDKIYSNLKLALASPKKVVVRVPVIPFFNYSKEDAKCFGALFESLNIREVNLLPFHQFGQGKYEKLTRDYTYRDIPSLQKEDLEDYKNIISKKVEKVRIGG